MKRLLAFLFIGISAINSAYSQNCSTLNSQLKSDISSTCNAMVMTMQHDQRPNMPYLYVANKEAGLKIYNISNLSAPTLLSSVPLANLNSLDVMNLSQIGDYLYLAIGNTFTNPQQSGMAIVDITNPGSPVVKDVYLVTGSTTGSGIVKTEGNYAYLGAMGSGLVILDITDKSNILFVSQFKPDINWPVNNPNASLYNARGMEVKNDIVYLCYDAGGLRIINCSNKSKPVETGRFANPKLYQPINLPRAYNNIIIDDTLAYVTVDYCGLEVLNIKDTAHITLVGWWNPYNCPNNNWFSSPVHANEIAYNKACKYAFISTGKSDMMVINLSNPSAPDSCNFYGGVSNNTGTWGVGSYGNQIYLSYVCSLIPFSSNYTGVKILSYTPCASGIDQLSDKDLINVSPNPFDDYITISLPAQDNILVSIYNVEGRMIYSQFTSTNELVMSTKGLKPGLYLVHLQSEKISRSIKLIHR